MRLSRIWRILQGDEGVIHRGRRPRWITSSEIWSILHILRKLNSIIALSFIQNIFKLLKQKMSFTFNNFAPSNNTISCPVFSVNGSIVCSELHFLRQRFNNLQWAALFTSLIQYDEASFHIWWAAAGYGEIFVWFQPIRNGEIFWMNNIQLSPEGEVNSDGCIPRREASRYISTALHRPWEG